MLDGCLWILRTGAPWRDLPRRFGPWQTVYHRYHRWQVEGLWPQILTRLDMEDVDAVLPEPETAQDGHPVTPAPAPEQPAEAGVGAGSAA
jgi:hypothetical protein